MTDIISAAQAASIAKGVQAEELSVEMGQINEAIRKAASVGAFSVTVSCVSSMAEIRLIAAGYETSDFHDQRERTSDTTIKWGGNDD